MARQAVLELVADATRLTRGLADAGEQSRSFGDKVEGAGRKMTALVSVPIIGFLGASTKAAMDDATAQDHLAQVLKNVGETHIGTRAAVEEYITSATRVSTFTDDELRPSYEALILVTGEAERAMDLQAVAMDLAAGKGLSLEQATNAVAKASEGNFGAVNKLIPGLLDLTDKTLTAEAATQKIADLFEGQASSATETVGGKAKMAARDVGEMSEAIGAQLLPAFTSIAGFATDTLIPALDAISGEGHGAIALIGIAAAGPVLGQLGKLKTALTAIATNHPAFIPILAAAGGLKIGKEAIGVGQDKGLLAGIGNLLGMGGKKGLFPESGGVLGFASGGTVPGPAGSPMLAMVHGGETITPPGGGGTQTIVLNVMLDGRQVQESLLRLQRTTGSLGFTAA